MQFTWDGSGSKQSRQGGNYRLCRFFLSPLSSADAVIADLQKKNYSRSRGPQQGSVRIWAEPQWERRNIFHSPVPQCISLVQCYTEQCLWCTAVCCLSPNLLQFIVQRFKRRIESVLITLYPSFEWRRIISKSMPVSLTEVGAWTWTTTDLFLHSQWIESPRPKVMLPRMEMCLRQAERCPIERAEIIGRVIKTIFTLLG